LYTRKAYTSKSAKKVFSPSSIVEYARLPAKTSKRDKSRGLLVKKERKYLEPDLFDVVLRSRRDAFLDDLGVGHDGLIELVGL